MIFVACGVFACSAQATAPPQGFARLGPATPEQQTYSRARELAINLVRGAAPELDARDRRLAAGVMRSLRDAAVLVSATAKARETCAARQYSMFINAYMGNRIYICDEVRAHARGGSASATAVIAQGMIHEAVHLAGQMDECEATRFEVGVMQLTIGVKSRGSQIRYGRECRGRW